MKVKKILAGVLAFAVISGTFSRYTIIKNSPIISNALNYTTENYSDYAEKVAFIVNQERAKYGLEPVKISSVMNQAASVRAEELSELFSHTRPDGSICFTIFDEYNIPFMDLAAENIHAGSSTPENAMESWMHSEGHRANILDENAKYIGVGIAYSSGYPYYWTQLFSDQEPDGDCHIPVESTPAETTTSVITSASTTTDTTTIKPSGGSVRFNFSNIDMLKGDVFHLNISGDKGDVIQVYFYYADEDGNMNADIIGALGGTVLDENGRKTVDFTAPNNLNDISVKIVYTFSEPSCTYDIDYNSIPEIVKGDITGDGTIDIADVVAAASYVGDSSQNQLSNDAIIAGDVHNTGDGLTGNDVLMIQQYIAKIITEL